MVVIRVVYVCMYSVLYELVYVLIEMMKLMFDYICMYTLNLWMNNDVGLFVCIYMYISYTS